MGKLKKKKGFTMLETMVVVSIIAILAAIGIGEYAKYQKQLVRLELDSTAKEIFIAAQNHLSMVEGQGYLLREDFGAEEGSGDSGICRFVVGEGCDNPDNLDSVLNLMLPFGSIEEDVRTGGSYVIRYQKYPACVLDVFYASPDGRWGHSFTKDPSEYETLISGYAGDEHKSERGNYLGKSIIGYYGGVEAQNLDTGAPLKTPAVRLVNSDTLYAEVSNPNYSNTDASLILIITGEQSGNRVSIPLVDVNGNPIFGSESYISYNADGFTVVLDDITSPLTRFEQLFCSGAEGLLPGENITLQAVAYSNRVYTNVARSAEISGSSLFASLSGGEAEIASFRHLENLSPEISGLSGDVELSSAAQTGDLVLEADGAVFNSSSKIYMSDGSASEEGSLFPVNPGRALDYQGNGYAIMNAVFASREDAGVFGTLKDSMVSDLELISMSVSSESGNAGGLVGSASGSGFTGILVRNDNSSDDSALSISGKLSTGGLAGRLEKGSVSLSAAAVYVKSSSAEAGGLIGVAEGTVLKGCYSGGHTVNARFSDEYSGGGRINIQGKTYAGGLIGSASGSFSLSSCYSTASCSAAVPGGLVGRAKNGTISNAYAAGRVIAFNGNPAGAFLGSWSSVSCSGKNRYLLGVSENAREDVIANVEGVSGKDTDNTGFILPTESKRAAITYDDSLVTEYQGRFSFPTVSQLDSELVKAGITDRHVGDWQIPSLEALPFTVYNEDTLHLRITPDEKTTVLILSLTGTNSGNTQVFLLGFNDRRTEVAVTKQGYVNGGNSIIWGNQVLSKLPVSYDGKTGKIDVVLDDITVAGHHFSELFTIGSAPLTPGENLEIRVGNGDAVWAELKSTGFETVNGLFANGSTFTQARISHVRHLQNLDPCISSVSSKLTGAALTRNISWNGEFYSSIYECAGSGLDCVSGGFYGLYNPCLSSFSGNNHTLSGFVISSAPSVISTKGAGNAGLFRLTGGSLSVSKLCLKDFSINAEGNAAALAAEITGSLKIDTVLAQSRTCRINKTGSNGAAGGLAGDVKGSLSIKNSAASSLISSSAAAGGLVGRLSSGSLDILESYAGGHTDGNKRYASEGMNITGSMAGGLLGEADGGSLTITKAFSAASVGGSTGGGIIGKTSVDAYLNTVYTVAPVSGIKVSSDDEETGSGAFIGQTGSGAVVHNVSCYYLPEIYQGAETAEGVSTVAYAGKDAALDGQVSLAYYEKDGDGNVISAKLFEDTMQTMTYPYDARLKNDGNEFPFSIWTAFSFDRSGKTGGSKTYGVYYGDWQPVITSATVLHNIVFKYADPLDGNKVKLTGDGRLGTQQIHEGKDNSLLPPYIKSFVGYSIEYWELEGTGAGSGEPVRLYEENGMLVIPSEYTRDDISVIARYSRNKGTYTIGFYYDPTGENRNFEAIGQTREVEEGTALRQISTPSRNISGYYFDGWYADSSLTVPLDFNGDSTISGDIHAYAKYQSLEYYTITIDFMYQISGGDSSHLVSVPRYRIDDERSQYKIRQLVGKTFDDYVILPTFSGYETSGRTNVSVTRYSEDEPGTAVLSADRTKLHITASSASHFIVLYSVESAEAPVDSYSYQIVYRLGHTASDGSFSATETLQENRYGSTIFTAPDGTVPDIQLENRAGYVRLTGRNDVRLEQGAGGIKVIYVDYERRQYTLSFDSKSGSYTAPVMMYYGQPLNQGKPSDPTRPGYDFSGWELFLKGQDRIQANRLEWTSVMPAHNVEASAVWNNGYSEYQVMFWYENSDDAGYTFVGSKDNITAMTGTMVSSDDWATYPGMSATGGTHTHSLSCYAGAGSTKFTTATETQKDGCCSKTTTYYKYNNKRITIDDTTSSRVSNGYVTGWAYTAGGGSGKCMYYNGSWYPYTGNVEAGSYVQCSRSVEAYPWMDTTHFTYNSGMKQTVEVLSDGSTVLNVYYSRNEYTLTFKENSRSSSNILQVKRKYNAPIADLFPVTVSGKVYNYIWDDASSPVVFDNYIQSIDRMPGQNVVLVKYNETETGKKINYYTEVVSGNEGASGVIARRIGNDTRYFVLYKTVSHNLGGSWHLTRDEEFHAIEGFTRWGYYEGTSTSTINADSTSKVSYTINSVNEFFYIRDTGKVELYVENEKYGMVQVQYGAKLIAVRDTVPQRPDKYSDDYTFSGWYLDPGLSSPVDFDSLTMPVGSLVVYGGWIPPSYTVSFYEDALSAESGENPLYSFEAPRFSNIGDRIADVSGNLLPEYIPVRAGWVFEGWYYMYEGEERIFINSQGILSDMRIHARWTEEDIQPAEEKRDITVSYVLMDGDTAVSLLEDNTENRQVPVGDLVTLYAEEIRGYYPEKTVLYYQVTDEENQRVVFTYVKIEPWCYTVEYYARYSSCQGGEALSGYSFCDTADYPVAVETGIEAFSQYETISFTLPEGYENYHLEHYEYRGESGSETSLTINSAEGKINGTVTVRYYIEPDDTRLEPGDTYRLYDGTSQDDRPAESVSDISFAAPLGATAQTLAVYRYYDSSGNPLEAAKVVDAGVYKEDVYVILRVNGVAEGETEASTKDFLILKSAGNLSLRIGKRSVILTSASAEDEYDGQTSLKRSDPETDITVSGDGFAEGEGVDISFTVDSFRLNPGSTQNAFKYEFREGTKAENYDVKTVFGTLTVGWRYQTEYYLTVSSIPGAESPGAVYPLSGTLEERISRSEIITDKSESFVEIPVVIPAVYSGFRYKGIVCEGGEGSYDGETGTVTLYPNPNKGLSKLKIYLEPDTDGISFAGLSAAEGSSPLFSCDMGSAALAGYEGELIYVYRYFGTDGTELTEGDLLEKGTYTVFAYALLRVNKPVSAPDEAPVYSWFLLKQQLDGKLKLTVG